jgi:Fur family ferric uptake transcriptional regulator
MADEKPRRSTRQRQIVLEELQKLHTHPTATELYEIARHRLPKLSLGTVYRNLELLADSGVIRKLGIGGPEARFDGDVSQHYHVRCVKCGRVDDAHGVPSDLLLDQVNSVDGYEITGLHLEYVGVCPACQDGQVPEQQEPSPVTGRKQT